MSVLTGNAFNVSQTTLGINFNLFMYSNFKITSDLSFSFARGTIVDLNIWIWEILNPPLIDSANAEVT